MSETTNPAPASARQPVTARVPLVEPIERESGNITSLSLRKPKAGELRGLSIKDLINSDVSAVMTVLPRISDPFITDQEVAALAAEDIAEIAGTIVGFFMSPATKRMVAEMIGTAQSTT